MTPRIPQAAQEPQQLARTDAVGELYRQHAVGLVRLALLLVGDQASAEDVVQEAFLGLYRNWPSLTDYGRLPGYLRVAVVNGSRGVLRARRRAWLSPVKHDPPVWSAEAAVMATEDRRTVLAAMAKLPRRQREVLVLRYYAGLADTVRPEAVRVLDLEPGQRPAGGRRAVRTSRVLGPLAAAASVALIAAGVVVVPEIIGATPSHHHRSRPRPASDAGPLTALPKFMVLNESNALDVAITATGRVVGHERVPATLGFDAVVGTASGRTFYVAADYNNSQGTCETYFYQFTLNADGQPSALKPLVVPKLTGLPTAIATNATGSLIAYSVVQCAGSGPSHIPAGQPIGVIGLIDLAVGKVTRQWSYTLSEDYTTDLSMSGNGRLLGYSNFQGNTLVARVLPITAPSGPDQRRSHIVVHGAAVTAVSVTGSLIYAVTERTHDTLAGYDTANGGLVKLVRQWPTALGPGELLAEPTGHYLLLSTTQTSTRKPKLHAYVRGHRCASFLRVAGKLMCRQLKPPQTRFISINLTTGKVTTLPFRQLGPARWGGVAW